MAPALGMATPEPRKMTAGGPDLSDCVPEPETGLCCVDWVQEQEGLEQERKPLLQCTQRMVEQCHYSYVTQFRPVQQEVCHEDFHKQCSITFKTQAYNETVKNCHVPVEKVCSGQGEEQCSTVFETSCATKYSEESPGKFLGNTRCERLPLKLCGAGCVFEEGDKECRDEVVGASAKVPQEVCDLNPQKRCRLATKLVPQLQAVPECTQVPKETCTMSLAPRQPGTQQLKSRWCLHTSQLPQSVHTSRLPPSPHTSQLPAFPPYNRSSADIASHQSISQSISQSITQSVPLQAATTSHPGDFSQPSQEIPFVGTYGVSSMLSDNVRAASLALHTTAPAITFLDANSLDSYSAPSPYSYSPLAVPPASLPPLDREMMEARARDRGARGARGYRHITRNYSPYRGANY